MNTLSGKIGRLEMLTIGEMCRDNDPETVTDILLAEREIGGSHISFLQRVTDKIKSTASYPCCITHKIIKSAISFTMKEFFGSSFSETQLCAG